MKDAPNIMLITADQWRADFFGYRGADFVRTPNLDKLAASASCFMNHFTSTVPCGPARASLLTGLYLLLHRSISNGTPLDASIPTLPRLARQAGYDPVLFGYTDTSADPRNLSPDDPRLTTYEGVMEGFRVGLNLNLDTPGEWLSFLHHEGALGIEESAGAIWHREKVEQAFNPGPSRYSDNQSNTRYLADHVISEIEGARQPFFIHASFLRPHPPLQAPAPWHQWVDPPTVQKPITRNGESLHPYQVAFDQLMTTPGYYDPEMNLPAMTKEDITCARAVYAGLGSEVDYHIGRIFDVLKAKGQYDNTMIIFTSDHGEMLGDHGNWGKQHWYDSCWHIPLIVKLPNQTQGCIVAAFTEAVDILPTIIEAIEQLVPENVHGHSLLSLAQGETASPGEWRDCVMLEMDFRDPVGGFFETFLQLDPEHCSCAILRDGNYKYVHFTDLPSVLYDLEKDPEETTNVVNFPEYQQVALSMARRLLSARMAASDRSLTRFCLTPSGIHEATDKRPRFRPLGSEVSLG